MLPANSHQPPAVINWPYVATDTVKCVDLVKRQNIPMEVFSPHLSMWRQSYPISHP